MSRFLGISTVVALACGSIFLAWAEGPALRLESACAGMLGTLAFVSFLFFLDVFEQK